MADERNKAIVRRLFQEVLDKRNLGAIPDIVGKNYLLHNHLRGCRRGSRGSGI